MKLSNRAAALKREKKRKHQRLAPVALGATVVGVGALVGPTASALASAADATEATSVSLSRTLASARVRAGDSSTGSAFGGYPAASLSRVTSGQEPEKDGA